MQPPGGETRPAAPTDTVGGGALVGLGARNLLARYAWVAGAVKGSRVLDAACGRGDGTRLLAAAGAASVSGAGADAEDITAALEAAGDIADFVVAPAHRLPFDDGSFDVVVCLTALDPDWVAESIAQLRRVLSPDGTLILALSGDDREGAPDGIAVRAAFDHVAVVQQTGWAASVVAEAPRAGDALKTAVQVADDAVPEASQSIALACASGPPDVPAALLTLGGLPSASWTEEHFLAPLRQVQHIAALNMRLEQELAAAGDALQRAEAGHADARSRAEARRTELGAARAHAQQLAANLAELAVRAEEYVALAERARALEELARAEAEDLQARLAAAESASARQIVEHALGAQRAIEEIERSLSWRITKPLRAIKRVARRGPPA